MKLLELYEDLFQYICLLNRWAKTQSHPEFERVRAKIRSLLKEIKEKAATDVRLQNQVAKLELPILFFVDNVICTSRLTQVAQRWAREEKGKDSGRLAWEKDERTGDEKFFTLLDQDLQLPSEEAGERLMVYYVCLGLGFTGKFPNQPEKLRQYMVDRIYPRISKDVELVPKITPDAYQHTNETTLDNSPADKLTLVALAFVFLCLSTLVIYWASYHYASKDLTGAVKAIEKHYGERDRH
jgi:type IV/VI secretion system ImpK/VasF family protein